MISGIPIKIVTGLKKTVDTVVIVKKTASKLLRLKDRFLTHNSDEKATVVSDAEQAEKLKAEGKEVLYLPGPEEPDWVQIKAYAQAIFSLAIPLAKSVLDIEEAELEKEGD